MGSFRLQVFQVALAVCVGSLLFQCGAVVQEVGRFKLHDLLERPMAKIYGGKNAARAYPYLVSIQYFKKEKGGSYGYEHFCGGAILDSYRVLTAAHCFNHTPVSCERVEEGECYAIVAGKRNIQDVRVRRGSKFGRGDVVLHGNYSGENYENDVALIFLREPLRLSGAVRSIRVVDSGVNISREGTIAGWGGTITHYGSSVLQEAEVEVLPDSKCAEVWGVDYKNESMICAVGVKALENGTSVMVDACYGDSGGPLIGKDDSDPSVEYVVGIISWGQNSECRNNSSPTVYTKVEAFVGWIRDTQREVGAGSGN